MYRGNQLTSDLPRHQMSTQPEFEVTSSLSNRSGFQIPGSANAAAGQKSCPTSDCHDPACSLITDQAIATDRSPPGKIESIRLLPSRLNLPTPFRSSPDSGPSDIGQKFPGGMVCLHEWAQLDLAARDAAVLQSSDETPLPGTSGHILAIHPVRPIRRRGTHEKRNVDQCPPAGGKPHCHR